MSDKDQTQVSTATDAGDAGYNKALKNRHIQMIAIGGSIGTGLFLGAGGRLAQGGPALAFAYAVCGVFAFLMVRALGELAVRRPSSGAFVSYAREFLGEKGAFITGWFFFLDWAVTVMADITAVALYMHYWTMFEAIPQWVIALIALALVFVLNMLSVKAFGEAEFWFAMIKVATILIFMAVAIWAIITQAHVGDYSAGVHNISESGGWFPEGLAPVFALTLGVVFAFGGTEMVGVAAGEAKDAADAARTSVIEYRQLSDDCKAKIAASAAIGVVFATQADIDAQDDTVIAPALSDAETIPPLTQSDIDWALDIINR